MIFSGFIPVAAAHKKVLCCSVLAVSFFALGACTPLKPQEIEPEPTVVEPVELELPAEPAPVELSCPEPEPVEPVFCPPPPKPKPCPVCPIGKIDGKLLVGAIEYVTVSPSGLVYTARIDSGAEGTSVHASNIVRFERDGEKWVKFDLDSGEGDPVTLERQVLRRVRVSQPGENSERRLVVMLSLTLGSLSEQTEIYLTDRSDMDQPILIGRNFLHNNAIVDVSQRFIAK